MDRIVKSARRVLEVLELFAENHEPMTVMQVVHGLKIPQSSTSQLLGSLQALGYLRYDPQSRTFAPTLRVMLLGSSVHDEVFGHGRVLALLEDLRREFDLSVIIGMQQGLYVRYIVTLCVSGPGAPAFRTGVLRPICRVAVGKALLSKKSDAEIGLIVRGANALAQDPRQRVSQASVLADVRLCQQEGWTETHGTAVRGKNVIAVPLPPLPNQPDLAIGLGGLEFQIGKQRSAAVARLKEVCRLLAPTGEITPACEARSS